MPGTINSSDQSHINSAIKRLRPIALRNISKRENMTDTSP